MNVSAVNTVSNLWSTYPTQPQPGLQTAAMREDSTGSQQVVALVQPVVQENAIPQAANVATTANPLPQQERGQSTNIAEQAQTMAATAMATASGVSTNTNLPELYKFYNEYLYGSYNNWTMGIDSDKDGYWDHAELTVYADAYERATGKTLDVDALMAKYSDTGDNTGKIGFSNQLAMYQDDALGISYVRDEVLRADMGISSNTSASSTKGGVNWKALDNFVDKYTYGYPGKMYANVDQNQDGVWTLDELKEYFSAYEKATGKKYDAEAIFNKYDRDGSGYLTYTEMNEMYRDDALGLSKIKDLLESKKGDSGKDTGPVDNKDKNDKLYNTLKDMWGDKFTSAQLRSLATTFNSTMQKSAMLDAFMYANNFISGNPWSRGSGYGGYGGNGGTYTDWMAASINMLGMFV